MRAQERSTISLPWHLIMSFYIMNTMSLNIHYITLVKVSIVHVSYPLLIKPSKWTGLDMFSFMPLVQNTLSKLQQSSEVIQNQKLVLLQFWACSANQVDKMLCLHCQLLCLLHYKSSCWNCQILIDAFATQGSTTTSSTLYLQRNNHCKIPSGSPYSPCM